MSLETTEILLNINVPQKRESTSKDSTFERELQSILVSVCRHHWDRLNDLSSSIVFDVLQKTPVFIVRKQHVEFAVHGDVDTLLFGSKGQNTTLLDSPNPATEYPFALPNADRKHFCATQCPPKALFALPNADRKHFCADGKYPMPTESPFCATQCQPKAFLHYPMPTESPFAQPNADRKHFCTTQC